MWCVSTPPGRAVAPYEVEQTSPCPHPCCPPLLLCSTSGSCSTFWASSTGTTASSACRRASGAMWCPASASSAARWVPAGVLGWGRKLQDAWGAARRRTGAGLGSKDHKPVLLAYCCWCAAIHLAGRPTDASFAALPLTVQAAPGYEMAKRIIKLVSAVADKVCMPPAAWCCTDWVHGTEGRAVPRADRCSAWLHFWPAFVLPHATTAPSLPLPSSPAPAGEQRPRGGRPAQGGVCARLQRQLGRDHHPRHRAQVGTSRQHEHGLFVTSFDASPDACEP